jgi:hypothetical protein
MCVFGGRFATVFGPTVGGGSISGTSLPLLRHHRTLVTTGLDPVVHADSRRERATKKCIRPGRMDCRIIGERSDAVLRTAMSGNDEMKSHSRGAIPRPSFANAATLKCEESGAIRKRRGGACFSLCAYARFARSRVSLRSTQATKKNNKGSGTPTDALSNLPCCWHGRASSRMRTSIGVPPRLLPEGDLLPKALLQAMFPGTRRSVIL